LSIAWLHVKINKLPPNPETQNRHTHNPEVPKPLSTLVI
jgi:hypothetical protein